MKYPLIKAAVMQAYKLRCNTLSDAIRQVERHYKTYIPYPKELLELNKEIGKTLELLQNDTTTYWDMSLLEANELFGLEIDFSKITRIEDI